MKKQPKKEPKKQSEKGPRSLSFGSLAEDYQKYRKTYNAALYKKIFALISSRKVNKVANNVGNSEAKTDILDLVCGTGKSTIGLIASAPRKMKSASSAGSLSVIGMDPDPMMLVEARVYAETHQLPIKYMEGSAEKLPFKKESFDAIISGTAFHWFATKKTFTKIRNTLKPDGVCVVFWTWKQKGQNEGREAESEVLKKYKWKTIAPKWRDTEEIRKLFVSSGFSDFATLTIPYTQYDDLDNLIGLCKTNSVYALMLPAQRKQFLSEITAAYTTILGPKKYLATKRDVIMCWGFK